MGRSIFEIIGPVMIGPSSSHTAGMARIGLMAHHILDMEPADIRLELSPKLRTLYAGHRSDAALIGGCMGYSESSDEIRDAVSIAREKGISTSVDFLPEDKYPQNTARITLTDAAGSVHSVTGTSVGGGSIQIIEVDNVPMTIGADTWTVILWSAAEPSGECMSGYGLHQTGVAGEDTVVSSFSLTDRPDEEAVEVLRADTGTKKLSVVSPVLGYGCTRPGAEDISSFLEMTERAMSENITLSELAVRYEMRRSGRSREEIHDLMAEQLTVIKESVRKGQQENRLLYGLTSGNDGAMLAKAVAEGRTISKGVVPDAVARAIGVMEHNGSMGCIVAAPTAGSSGIIPGSMTAVQDAYDLSDEKMIGALFVSALMGVVMDKRGVSFSGSVGGCQGEIGVSSAITAAGLTSLFTDDPEAVTHAMALCLKNLLGLVCDPIAGPIEVPCIKRNAVGAANAFISSDMALAGIRSFIPPDEVIDALIDVEKRLPDELKSGTVGGLACTNTAKCVRARLGQ